jgi:hypothetical protein
MNTTPVSLLERFRQPSDQAAWRRFVAMDTPLLVWRSASLVYNGRAGAGARDGLYVGGSNGRSPEGPAPQPREWLAPRSNIAKNGE